MNKQEEKKNVTKYLDHLEFLGYEVILKQDVYMIFQQEEIIAAFTIQVGGILLRNYFSIVEKAKKDRKAILEYVNNLNSSANIVRFILEEDYDLNMVYWFDISHYDKSRFGLIWNLWKQDTIELLNETKETIFFLHDD